MEDGRCPIEYLDYDKISDTLLWLNNNTLLRFNVTLASKDKFQNRKSFHHESVYESKFSNVRNAYSIKRDMNFFWTIEDLKNPMTNNVMITLNDIFFFKFIVENKILPWFIGNKSIFGTNPDNGSIMIKGKWKPEQFALTDQHYLEFHPIVISYNDGKTTSYGIRMIMNDPNNIIDMELNRFMAMYQLIVFSDAYAIACSMVNYVKIGPHGLNLYDVRNRQMVSREDVANGNIPDKGKSYFDKL
ncbi:MAG: hypothetical protein NC548_15670 [Lachnospiraceae bacterium]|nr:hypothetical protein [Lachnospiraceae bacterium]